MSHSITFSTEILTLAIAPFLFFSVVIPCKFALVPDVYILQSPEEEEMHSSSWGDKRFKLLLVIICLYNTSKNMTVIVLAKSRNDLNPTETIWNHLKPPRNYLKPPETNHIIVFFTYSQVEFVLILHPKVSFGQIWSQKLKFLKLTKIWYGGTLLYLHFEFNVYFSKIFVIHRGTLLYVHFEFNVYFSKIFITHIFFGQIGPKIWSSPN